MVQYANAKWSLDTSRQTAVERTKSEWKLFQSGAIVPVFVFTTETWNAVSLATKQQPLFHDRIFRKGLTLRHLLPSHWRADFAHRPFPMSQIWFDLSLLCEQHSLYQSYCPPRNTNPHPTLFPICPVHLLLKTICKHQGIRCTPVISRTHCSNFR